MKLVVAICLLTFTAFGQIPPRIMEEQLAQASKPKIVVSDCTTVSQTTASENTTAWFGEAANVYEAASFWASNSISCCKITVTINVGQADTVVGYVSIYSNNGGVPGTMIGGESDGKAWAGHGSGWSETYALSSSASLTSGTIYWLVYRTANYTGASYGYLKTATGGIYNSKYSPDGLNWSSDAVGRIAAITLYK